MLDLNLVSLVGLVGLVRGVGEVDVAGVVALDLTLNWTRTLNGGRRGEGR